jgi:hypothetical protein
MDPGVWEEITKMVEQVPGILGVIKNVGGAKTLDLEKIRARGRHLLLDSPPTLMGNFNFPTLPWWRIRS